MFWNRKRKDITPCLSRSLTGNSILQRPLSKSSQASRGTEYHQHPQDCQLWKRLVWKILASTELRKVFQELKPQLWDFSFSITFLPGAWTSLCFGLPTVIEGALGFTSFGTSFTLAFTFASSPWGTDGASLRLSRELSLADRAPGPWFSSTSGWNVTLFGCGLSFLTFLQFTFNGVTGPRGHPPPTP